MNGFAGLFSFTLSMTRLQFTINLQSKNNWMWKKIIELSAYPLAGA